MKSSKIIAAIGLAVLPLLATAQNPEPQVTTVTNIVTITVTNIVTVTNLVTAPPAPAPAPAPAAALPPPEPKYPWESSLTMSLTMTRGNSHSMLYSGRLETAKKTPENEYSLGAEGDYGSQDQEDSINNYSGYGQWNHLFSERFYSYVRGAGKRDLIADLDYRFNVGPGVGYYLIKATNTTLSVEAGAGYAYEYLGSEYNSYGTVRFAEQFEHKFSNGARIWQKLTWLPQVDEIDNYLVNFEVGAEAMLSKTFSLNTRLIDDYQRQPAAGRLKNDVKIISGIGYKF